MKEIEGVVGRYLHPEEREFLLSCHKNFGTMEEITLSRQIDLEGDDDESSES